MPFGNLSGNAPGMLGKAINDLTGAPSSTSRSGGKRDTFDAARFSSWNGSNLVAGAWVDLAEYVVEPQNSYRLGYGSAPVEDTVGRWFMHFTDGTDPATGFLRVQTRDSNDEDIDTVVSRIHTDDLAPEGSTMPDKRNRYAQPETIEEKRVGEDSKIVLQFELSSGSTATSITEAGTDMIMQNTRYSRERSQ